MFNQSRSYIIRIIFVAAFLVMIGQLFNLQVMSSEYTILAEQNALVRKTIHPTRGVVFDRKGNPIVTNTLMYDLMVTPNEAKGIDTAYVCKLLQIDVAEFEKRMLNAIIKGGRTRASAFHDLLTPAIHARLQENMWRLGSGFFLQERPVRE